MDENYYEKSTRHCDNIREIDRIIHNFTFTDLMNYIEFDWVLLPSIRYLDKIFELGDAIFI